MDDKTFAVNTPADFTDALKWYAIAKEKQNDYQNAYQKLKEQMEMNMKLRQQLDENKTYQKLQDEKRRNEELRKEANELRQQLNSLQIDVDADFSDDLGNQKTNAEYLINLLNRACRNVRELRVVFREPDPWGEDDERIF